MTDIKKRTPSRLATLASLLLSLGLTTLATGQVIGPAEPPIHYGDFDGDGFDDLVIGVPGEGIGTRSGAGAINVLYGTEDGLAAPFNQIWHQSSPGDVGGRSENNDRFGSAVAIGDFNGDTFSDVAIGVPGEDIGDLNSAGAVNVLYGSPAGLTADDNQIWHQGSPGVPGAPEVGDVFGAALAADDFDRDGYTDLAIGVPWEDLGNTGPEDHGMVNVLYGSANGLTAGGAQAWHQNNLHVQGETAAHLEFFGTALTTGDFDHDGFADLAVGVPGEEVDGMETGAVNVIYGSAIGLSNLGSQLWHQGTVGDLDRPEATDDFGSALAAGDFDDDGFADLAIGVPGEKLGNAIAAGAVDILYGSTMGLSSHRHQFWHQDFPGIRGKVEPLDRFGTTLAVGDFDRDGRDDLAIGVPDENVGSIGDAGAVNVLFGSPSGLTAEDNQIWDQRSEGVRGASEPDDHFGLSLTTGDYDGDGYVDLTIGVPREDLKRDEELLRNAGAVNVLYGSPGGPTATGNQIWHQDSAGIEGKAEPQDNFGGSLGRGID